MKKSFIKKIITGLLPGAPAFAMVIISMWIWLDPSNLEAVLKSNLNSKLTDLVLKYFD